LPLATILSSERPVGLKPDDIITGVYLRPRLRRFDFGSSKVGPVNYVGMVCEASADEIGRVFELRYLHPAGINRKGVLYWSNAFYVEDLRHFELIELEKVKDC
jgi:hypothetical protein